MPVLATKDATMQRFGTVNSFDEVSGHGSIRPINAGSDLGFESSDLSLVELPLARRADGPTGCRCRDDGLSAAKLPFSAGESND